jgi:tetraacyldisaccharide 4'-kinase
VVCADRYRGGRVAEQRFKVDVHLLDDGFQHLSLARDLNLLVLDATCDLSREALLPAGRLREPLSAAKRADAVVITRCHLGDANAAQAAIQALNPDVKTFHTVTRLTDLVDAETGGVYPPGAFAGDPVHAFCGIGNPRVFFEDLARWRFRVVMKNIFSDHHVYSRRDLAALLAAQKLAEERPVAMITTEKDATNLPAIEGFPVPVVACAIETEVRELQEFETLLLSAVSRSQARR